MTNRIQTKKLMIASVIAILLVALVVVLVIALKPKTAPIIPGEKEATIFIASDIHLYSNNLLSDDNVLYVKENFTSDGRIQEYDYELVSALISQVNKEKPEFLILTGDLSYNGEKDSHLELIKMLNGVNPKTKVLVIPGNHDTYSLNCVSALDDVLAPVESVSKEEFKELYCDFGYSDAYSRDDHSLSYIYEISNDKWALMLDTTQTQYNDGNGFNVVGGFVERPTMLWLEENLKYAKEHGISVVSFSHHNLLVHNELFRSNYTLYNNDDVLDLLTRYGVKLNFSGHLHVQSIKSKTINGIEIYDVSGGSLLDWGNRYGKLEIFDNCYSYTSHSLIGESDLNKYSFDVFCKEYYDKSLEQNVNKLGEDKGKQATELLSKINAYYFDGSYEEIHKLVKSNKKLISFIKNNLPGYKSSYVGSIIDVSKQNQHTLLIER